MKSLCPPTGQAGQEPNSFVSLCIVFAMYHVLSCHTITKLIMFISKSSHIGMQMMILVKKARQRIDSIEIKGMSSQFDFGFSGFGLLKN